MRIHILFRSRLSFFLLALIVGIALLHPALAQTPNPIDDETDPVKLFERGQDAHAKNDYKTAIQFYEAAIKLKPDFPEAEFQRAMALLVTNRKDEALQGFNRAVALRPEWPLAYAKFGSLLSSYFKDDRNAEPILRRALQLDGKNFEALVALADIYSRAGNFAEALKYARTATELETATVSSWRQRSFIEAAVGDKTAALYSLDQALKIDPKDLGARFDRARRRLDAGDNGGAFADVQVLEQSGFGHDVAGACEFALLYARAGKRDQALRVLDALTEKEKQTPEVVGLRAELVNDGGSSAEERAALEQLLQRDPKNTDLLARLGEAYRRVDPLKSEDYFYRALQIEPKNVRFAIGYASALVQARRFADAIVVLQRIIAAAPNEYVAHANLALALYEMKNYAAAIPEYEWLAAARPEIAVTYFFMASAHDNLGEYQQALDAYEKFLARAAPVNNKLDIEKVNLRLPRLRDQIKRGQGKKSKP
jgi:tetratricopeptide (TPR) repeat protein